MEKIDEKNRWSLNFTEYLDGGGSMGHGPDVFSSIKELKARIDFLIKLWADSAEKPGSRFSGFMLYVTSRLP